MCEVGAAVTVLNLRDEAELLAQLLLILIAVEICVVAYKVHLHVEQCGGYKLCSLEAEVEECALLHLCDELCRDGLACYVVLCECWHNVGVYGPLLVYL